MQTARYVLNLTTRYQIPGVVAIAITMKPITCAKRVIIIFQKKWSLRIKTLLNKHLVYNSLYYVRSQMNILYQSAFTVETTMRSIYHALIAQVQIAQYQTLGVGVIAFTIKRINYARKVIFRFQKNWFQKFKQPSIRSLEAFQQFPIYFQMFM